MVHQLINDVFGERRAHVCVTLILLDHLATTTASAALLVHHLPRLWLAAAASILLTAVLWRGTFLPIGTRDIRAAMIVRTTAISGLLAMTWCGTRCLTRPRSTTNHRWRNVFPRSLGLLGVMVAFRDTVRRRHAAHALMILSLYTLLLSALITVALVHETPMGIARLGLQILIVVIGLLIVFFDFAPRSRYRREFITALIRQAKADSGGRTTCTGMSGGRRFSSLRWKLPLMR
jgi:hypothetical protein